MKHCNKCDTTKCDDAFYKRKASKDGLAAMCKACQYRYDLARVNLPKRVEARRQYLETEQGRQRSNAAKYTWRRRNPEKAKAHRAVNYALEIGRLVKPNSCERCGSSDRIQAHHRDYSHLLDVDWVCAACHAREHRQDRMTMKLAEKI